MKQHKLHRHLMPLHIQSKEELFMKTNLNNTYIISQQWENKLNAAHQQAATHYGSVELLMDMLCNMLAPYLQVPRIAQVWEIGGLRPSYMLDVTHPACLADAMAVYCLQSYDPEEADYVALQRCIVDLLDQNLKQMEAADLSSVQIDGVCWEQYALDSLLRLVWRQQGASSLEIPCYLQKDSPEHLSDPFLMQVKGNWVYLTQCTHNRCYEIHLEDMDYETFLQHIHRCFQLATEDYGCFVPKYVWLSHAIIKKEACYD